MCAYVHLVKRLSLILIEERLSYFFYFTLSVG